MRSGSVGCMMMSPGELGVLIGHVRSYEQSKGSSAVIADAERRKGDHILQYSELRSGGH